jgi:hypothetical protein
MDWNAIGTQRQPSLHTGRLLAASRGQSGTAQRVMSRAGERVECVA